MKQVVIAFLGVMIFSSPAFSAGYGDAGCGLGSIIFGDESGPVQILAVTMNGLSYNQVFGVTSGTSNCDTEGLVLAEKEDHVYFVQNFDSLKKEMASGQGEHLRALSSLLGCRPDEEVQFTSYAQQNYQTIFASTQSEPKAILTAMKKEISDDPELAALCAN